MSSWPPFKLKETSIRIALEKKKKLIQKGKKKKEFGLEKLLVKKISKEISKMLKENPKPNLERYKQNTYRICGG